MNTRLSPIEKPKNPLMKLAYWITKRKFGKVISPLKTVYARMPIGFALWANKIKALEKQLAIPEELALLIKIQVAQLNGCHFCIDIGKAQAIGKFERQERFYQVSTFEESALFSQKEKLALRFATELTLQKKVTDQTYRLCQQAFSDEALVGLAWAVGVEHYYNMVNLAFGIASDGLCAMQRQQPTRQTAVAQLP